MIGIYVSGRLVLQVKSRTAIGIVTTGKTRTGELRFDTVPAGDLPKRMPPRKRAGHHVEGRRND